MGRSVWWGLTGIGRSCLIVSCRGGCPFSGDGSCLRCSWQVWTRARFRWRDFSWGFFRWFSHQVFVVGTHRGHIVYRKWSSTGLITFRGIRWGVWHDRSFWVVSVCFWWYRWLWDTLVWSCRLVIVGGTIFWFVCVIGSGCFRWGVTGWFRIVRRTTGIWNGFRMTGGGPLCRFVVYSL